MAVAHYEVGGKTGTAQHTTDRAAVDVAGDAARDVDLRAWHVAKERFGYATASCNLIAYCMLVGRKCRDGFAHSPMMFINDIKF